MDLFDGFFDEVNQYLGGLNRQRLLRTSLADLTSIWPRDTDDHVIFESDTAIELGHPRTESFAFMQLTESAGQVIDNRVTVIGPDLPEIKEKQVPFGKITLLRCHGLTEDNISERYSELDMVRIKIRMRDYMLRATPQNMKEWSRVSKKGLKAGLSFQVLGSELIRDYKKYEYVDAVEVIFVTSNAEEVRRLKPTGEKVARVIDALNKMFDDLEPDCTSCDFNDICNEINDLRKMHNKMAKKTPGEGVADQAI